MRILWAKSDFLHPTTRGGQIRTLEMLRRLHRRHEIHYVALDSGRNPEGPARAGEYSTKAYPIPHRAPEKTSPAFALQLLGGLLSPLPVAISRWRSPEMRETIAGLLARMQFDSIVCDFLAPAQNLPDISKAVLFQHNVETMIWRRHAEHASDPLRKFYFGLQARRMFTLEAEMSRRAARVVAVSANDAETIEREFGLKQVCYVPTGVDTAYFARPERCETMADLVFVGAMDWYPNADGVEFFVRVVWPLIRQRRPSATLAVVGHNPPGRITELARAAAGIKVTGTVPDVRPYLWGSRASIVPLRIGGGTRLKIYEAMAAERRWFPLPSAARGCR